MYNFLKVIFSVCLVIQAQDDTKNKKRKVYRTQSGSIIEAPKPLFEIKEVDKKPIRKKTINEKPKALARTKKVESTYRNELDSLKNTVSRLLEDSQNIKNRYEKQMAEKFTDTIFVYTTLYDTTTVKDTTFIYTNATTTV